MDDAEAKLIANALYETRLLLTADRGNWNTALGRIRKSDLGQKQANFVHNLSI